MNMPDYFSVQRKFLQFTRRCLHHFVQVNGSLKAGALAYATLISVVPVMVLSFGFVLAFPSLSEHFQSLHRFLFRHFVPSSAQSIQAHLEKFAHNATNLSATGMVFFLITSVLLVFTMEAAFNAIWEVKTRRKGFKAFLMYWAVLTLMPPLGVLAIALWVYLDSVPYLTLMMEILGVIVPFILTFCGFLLLYMTVPNCTVRFRDAAYGAIFSAFLFEITKVSFSEYVTYFSSDTVVYGVLSVIPAFLLWLYLSWLITIIGAVIAHQSGLHRRAPKGA